MRPIDGGGSVVVAFATPVVIWDVPGHDKLNGPIADMLKTERESNPTPAVAAIEGWQTANDLTTRPHSRSCPEMQGLLNAIGVAVLRISSAELGVNVSPEDCMISAEAWGNIMNHGDVGIPHRHMRSDVVDHWSGVYYVDAGDGGSFRNGSLELLDPRPTLTFSGPGKFQQPFTNFTIAPKTGTMVVFPAWMNHWVYPYRGNRERISIAFNARVEFNDKAEFVQP